MEGHEFSARILPVGAPHNTDSDLTVAVYDNSGIRLFAMGPIGFHIPRDGAHLDAAEKVLKSALTSLQSFKSHYKRSL